MIYDDSREFCIFMTFDLKDEQIERCRALAEGRYDFEYEQDGLIGKMYLGNRNCDSVDFEQSVSAVKEMLGERIYAESDLPIEDCIVPLATEYGVKIGVAESLTGGMVCARLVNVSGSSEVLQEGYVSYTNASKVRQLHVKIATLEEYGAVSEQIAREMVAGVLSNRAVNLAVATTGCAGPNSDENDTPVGLVYVGIGNAEGVKTYELFFDGPRNYVRKCTTDFALFTVLQYLKKYASTLRG